MKLLLEDIEYLITMSMKKFRLTRAGAEKVTQKVQNMLEHNDAALLYDIAYTINYKNNTPFIRKILAHILECFTYIYRKEEYKEFQKELEKIYWDFQTDLFIQLCDNTHQIEERNDAARRILLHTSKRLSTTLDTQELMIANISHEMRTSLNAIYGYLSFIDEKDILRTEEKNYLRKASSATNSLKALVSDILNVTKLNSGQIEIIEESFWLDKMILKCIDNVSLELKGKPAITLKTNIDFLATKVYGDQNHIMEIIINILSNAIKYTEKGFIELSLDYHEIKNNMISIQIQINDSGIGMTPEQVEQIFAPYSRFKTEKKGLGLGLHIAKELAKKLNGKLKVESTFGEGSQFCFQVNLKIDKDIKIDLKGKKVCYYIGDDSVNLEKKMNFMRESGADLHIFDNESKFIHSLLTNESCEPDYAMIITDRGGYAKFDALIYYLRTLDIFKKTIFIAEKIPSDISLNYFSKTYEYIAPISIYNKKKNKITNKKSEITNDSISILAVDDTETNLEILKMFIGKLFPNIIVDVALGGYEAIGMYKIKKYNLVFLDLKMPGLNGFEVLSKLRQIRSDTTVYAFTADVYKSNYDKVIEAGFAGLMEKPLQPKMLKKIIQGILDESTSK